MKDELSVYTPIPPFVPLTKADIVPSVGVCIVAPIYILPETMDVTVSVLPVTPPLNTPEKLRDAVIVLSQPLLY